MRVAFRTSHFATFVTLVALAWFGSGAQAAPEGGEGPNQLDAKMTAYIECYNRLDGSAHSTIRRYVSWVKDMKVGPTGRERIVYGLYQVNSSNIGECQKKFSAAHEMRPSIALDQVAADYIKSLGEFGQLVDEMYPYYDREDYKDDKFAKGKQFHQRFVVEVERFRTASQKFADELDVENDKRLEAKMAQVLEQEGRGLTYLNMATMHRAKLLVRVLTKDDGPVEEIIARLDAFEKATDEMVQFAKDNPNGLPAMWSMFPSSVEDFRKAAKERMRRLRDKTPYSQGDMMMINAGSGWMISGTPEKVIQAYNELVNRSNRLR